MQAEWGIYSSSLNSKSIDTQINVIEINYFYLIYPKLTYKIDKQEIFDFQHKIILQNSEEMGECEDEGVRKSESEGIKTDICFLPMVLT